MKTRSLFFWGLLLLTGCNHRPPVASNEYLIEGHIEELPDSCVIQLLKQDGNMLKVVTLDTVIQGRFTLKDTLTHTTKFAIIGRGSQFPGSWVDLWVDPGSYTSITGKGYNIKTWKYDNETPEQQSVNTLLNATRTEWKILGNAMIAENQWNEQARQHHDNDSIRQLSYQKIDSICQQKDSLKTTILVKEMEMFNQMPVSSWWLDYLRGYVPILQYDPTHPIVPFLLKAAERMTEEDKQTPSGKVIMSYMNLPKAVKTGDEMADGDLYDVDGRLHHLAELKGKYILLDFWSSGCGPCVAAIPEMEEIARQYASHLVAVGICEDGESSWKEFIRKKQLKGIQWNQLGKSNPELKVRYRVNAIPHYVLISPEGKVIDQWSGYDKNYLKEKVKSHLP